MFPLRSDDPADREPNRADTPQYGGPAAAPGAPADAPAPSVPLVAVTPPRRNSAAVYAALFVVAVLARSALFVSGFSLGRQQAATPGTADSLQQRFEPFWDAYHKIDREYVGTVDEKKLVEGAIDGMFKALGDPYSSYMSSDEYRRSLSGLSGEFEGVGAEMTSRDRSGKSGCSPAGPNCLLVVVRPLPGSPAEKAGVRPNDEVIAVDRQSVQGLTLDETVTRVRGKRGTPVTITFRRGAREFDLRIVRDVIRTQDVFSTVLGAGRVGYIRINGFSSNAAGDFKQQLEQLVRSRKVSSLVLDLRDDPGGFVDAARTIASQFVGKGPIFWEEYADGRKIAQQAEPGGIATDAGLRMIVLVNAGTASASEIVAGALQDTGRARLVGEKTYGKGTIQQWQTLTNDTGGFRLSIAKWLTPKQRWIHEKGLQPDVAVKDPADAPTGNEARPDKDPALKRALELLTGTAIGALRAAA